MPTDCVFGLAPVHKGPSVDRITIVRPAVVAGLYDDPRARGGQGRADLEGDGPDSRDANSN